MCGRVLNEILGERLIYQFTLILLQNTNSKIFSKESGAVHKFHDVISHDEPVEHDVTTGVHAHSTPTTEKNYTNACHHRHNCVRGAFLHTLNSHFNLTRDIFRSLIKPAFFSSVLRRLEVGLFLYDPFYGNANILEYSFWNGIFQENIYKTVAALSLTYRAYNMFIHYNVTDWTVYLMHHKITSVYCVFFIFLFYRDIIHS